MATRLPGTDRNGNPFAYQTKLWVWLQAKPYGDFSADTWRIDKCGTLMNWNEYGNRNAETGWEIDHIKPVKHDGNDDWGNLQALNWKNNLAKSDTLNWDCPQKPVLIRIPVERK